jgi:hypothetical protein
MGQRAVVTDYYSVQVKSNDSPWKFETADEIRWVFEYPTPLFLACVDKGGGVLSIYHTMPRFLAGFYPVPQLLELAPTALDDGVCVQWAEGGQRFSLSAPILRVSLVDLLDEARLLTLREVLQYWVTLDSYNCDLRRMGLLRFRMPDRYRVNEAPLRSGTVEQGMTRPTPEQLGRAVRTLFEAADCVGDQLRTLGDYAGAIRAALLVRHLRSSRATDFETDPRWQGGISSGLEMGVSYGLSSGDAQAYVYEHLDKIANVLDTIDFVVKYLRDGDPAPHAAGES